MDFLIKELPPCSKTRKALCGLAVGMVSIVLMGIHLCLINHRLGTGRNWGTTGLTRLWKTKVGICGLKPMINRCAGLIKRRANFFLYQIILREESKSRFSFRKILGAANGLVWLEAVEDGIFCVNQKDVQKSSIVNYKKDAASGYQLPSNTINFFHEDADHQIWIGTRMGLCYLTRTSAGVYTNSKLLPDSIFQGENITAYAEDAAKLYFTTADGKLILFDKKLQVFSTRSIATGRLNSLMRSKRSNTLYITSDLSELITIQLQDLQISKTSYPKGERLLSIYEDKKGILWIEPEMSGAIRFDPVSKAFQYFSQNGDKGFSDIGNRFRVLEDNNGTTWINMKEGGFVYYNETSHSVDNLVKTPDASSFQLPKLIFTINYDTTGVLWFTTYEKELVKLILLRNDFRQQLLAEQGGTTPDNEVRGIIYDYKNRLWVGAKNGQVHVFQNDIRLKNLFDNEPIGGIGLVYSMLQDSRGNIWLGTKGNGLYKASPLNQAATKYHLTHFLPDKSDSRSLPCSEIYALTEDLQGRIWIGSYDYGLVLVKEEPAGTSFIKDGPVFKNYPKGSFQKIRSLKPDHVGNIWIGTTDGLVLLNIFRSAVTGIYLQDLQ